MNDSSPSFFTRSLLLAAVILFLSAVVSAQSGDRNYILTRTMLNEPGTAFLDRVDYLDGLGRPVQSVQKKSSPGQTDIVTLLEYDGAGRPRNAYLPVPLTTSAGAYAVPATVKTRAGAFYADTRAFEETLHEPSPLNRVDKVYGPGAAWHANEKPVTFSRHTNASTGELACTLYSVASDNSLKRTGLYAPGELFVTKTTGEDGRVTYTFTDKLGQLVLERAMNGTIMNDTYHVRDHYGNLRYVLPPAASDLLTATATWNDENTVLKDHAYIYKYDNRNRCTVKKLPGREPVEMRYDKADRLTFSRDGEQRSNEEWSFYLHDVLGRPVVTGTWVSPTIPNVSGTVVEATYDAGGTRLGGYTVNLTLPGTVRLATVNYYDDHSFTSGVPQLDHVTPPAGYGTRFTSAKGLLTGTRAYRLNDPARYTVSAYYHDHRGRVVQTRSTNHLGGHDHEYFAYTFTGKVKKHQRVHSNGTESQTETYTYDYGTPETNPTERLLSILHKLNDSPQVTLAQYGYDEVGRVKTKKLAAETSTYAYNVRSWLTRITGTRFNQTLAYNTAVNGVTPAKELYNGNISAMKWKAGNETTERGYKFTYDGLDRLTAATYGEGSAINTNPDRFNETLTYNDKMGNIETLVRRGKLNSGYGEIDNLTYTYTGNQLTKVSDAVTTSITYENAFHFVDRANVENEYTYDANDNLTRDLNKNITSVSYNVLSLPEVITFANGNTITYDYDGSGSKLSVAYYINSNGITTRMDYAGNKVYNNGTLSMILTEEGYVTLSGSGTPTYHYYLKDHQGNNRVVMDQAGTVLQVNHYYPFGGLFGEGVQDRNQRYKYNGKELDRLFGLDLYDYGARHYDAATGRWWEPDPLAEKYFSISPYVYVANNPVRFIDPTGMFYDDYSINEKEKRIIIVKQNEKIDRVYDKDNPKGLEIEKGSFDIVKYRDDGYSIETLTPAGMVMTDFVASNVVGGAILAKVGGLVGKGISAWRASRVAKAVETTVEVGTNAAKGGTTALTKFYPANNGFLGTAERTFLMPGQQISRFGSNSGKFFSPAGTPLPMRALPPGANTSIHNTFRVLKPFEVQAGKIAPAFGQPGLGTQYLSPVSVDVLLKRGIIGY